MLRRRPAGRDRNPLFSYLQAAARLYLSIDSRSGAEHEAVVGRLARSAKTLALGQSSRNYLRHVLSVGEGCRMPIELLP